MKLRLCFVLAAISLAMCCTDLLATTVTIPYPGVAGGVIKSTEYNANLNTIANAINAVITDVAALDSQLPTTMTLSSSGGEEELLDAGNRFEIGAATCSSLLRMEYTATNGVDSYFGTTIAGCAVGSASTTAKIMGALSYGIGAGASGWSLRPEAGVGGVIKMWASGPSGIDWTLKVTPVTTIP